MSSESISLSASVVPFKTFVTKNFILYRKGIFKTKATEEQVTTYKEV